MDYSIKTKAEKTCAFILAVCVFTSVPAYSQSATILIGSKHYATSEKKQELNPGLIGSKTWGNKLVVAGSFLNSENRVSVFTGVGVQYKLAKQMRVSATFGVASGYGSLNSIGSGPQGTVPYVTQSLHLGPPKRQLMIIHAVGAIALGFKWNL